MKKILKENFKKITALLLVISMTLSFDLSALAQEIVIQDDVVQNDAVSDETAGEDIIQADTNQDDAVPEDTAQDEIVQEDIVQDEETVIIEETPNDETEAETDDTLIEETSVEEITKLTETFTSGSMSESDEEAKEREAMPASDVYLKKFLTYLSLKYPEIGIECDPETGAFDYSDAATKMKNQTAYNTIEIDGDDTFEGYPDLTKNMVQFKFLGNFGESTGSDGDGHSIYSDTVKTLKIRNVDEIRNLYVPASVETLMIENTTFNCYQYPSDSPGFQSGMNPGDLANCKNLKKLVIKNVKFGDNYKRGNEANLLPEITYNCPYETNYRLNLMNCHNLEELEINVSFDGAREVQLAIDGGTENLFEKLTEDKCTINPAPGSGYEQVALYSNSNSNLSKYYSSSETVEFKNKRFRLWLLEAIGVDSNNDGVISQKELDTIDNLVINDQTAHSAEQTSLSAFQELADIGQMHGLKTLEIDFYDPGYASNGNRQTLKGIDFPASLENLTMRNIYWEKDTQTKSHDNADIKLTNLKSLKLYNSNVKVDSGDSYFNHHTQIVLTDTEGVLQSCIIEKTDVESITLINNSAGKGIKNQDEKQRIRFSASDCQNLTSIEFLGEGYAVEGSLDLTNDKELTHIGIPNEGRTQWTVYGEFDSTYAPINVFLNSCAKLGSDCNEIIIDYDFINGRNLNVQTMNTNFSDAHKLSIYRIPRITGDTAGKVYLSCDVDSWIYNHYKTEEGFVIEDRTSFPTIALLGSGQRIRTAGEGTHNSDSNYTEDTDLWVERWNLVLAPNGYTNGFGNLAFYVVDKMVDEYGNTSESLRRVFYGGEDEPVYVEWTQQEEADPIITLPTVKDATGGYKLTGSKLSSTGMPGEVELKLYVYNAEGVKSYIGFQNIKVFKMPDSVELVNDGTERGSGTKDDPFIIDKDEELKLKARLLVDGDVDRSGDYALRDIYWRIKEYDETPKYTSDSDGYSLYTLDSATKAGISVVRGSLNDGETLAQYDKRKDNERVDGQDPTYYNHRRFLFNTAGSKFKIVAQSPFKNNDAVITKEIFVEYHSKALSIDVSNDIVQGEADYEEASITINNIYNTNSVSVSIKNPELYYDCFAIEKDSSSIEGKEIWKLRINDSNAAKVKGIINSNSGRITLLISADGRTHEKNVNLSSVIPNIGCIWYSEIEDPVYTGKAVKPKLNIYYGNLLLREGKDYTLSYGNNVKAASKAAVDKRGKRIGPSITIKGKGNLSDKQIYYFSIKPCSIENTAKVNDILVAKTNYNIKITPTVVLNGKKLKQGVDYVVSTTTDVKDAIVSLKEPNEYPLYIVGKGNYTGAAPFKFTITSSVPASKAAIKSIANQKYAGTLIQPAVNITYNKKDVTDCFDITYENNKEIGTATVIATAKITADGEAFAGKAGYSFAGSKKTTFKIVGTSIASAKLGADGKGKIESATYSGTVYEPELNVYVGTTSLIKGDDYEITYKNNTNAGTATAIITGKGKYSGTKKFTYKINKYDAAADSEHRITVNEYDAGIVNIEVVYEKGGVKPKPIVSFGSTVLKEKKDYTLSYANQTAVKDKTASKAPKMTITFKGNYSGKKTVLYSITKKDISGCTMTVGDMVVSTKVNGWKQTKATIQDTNGKILKAKTDYNASFQYFSDPECTAPITESKLGADELVYVKVTGINNYKGTITGSYRISKRSISSVKTKVTSSTVFTGKEIKPAATDITVTIGSGTSAKTLIAGTDYEIVPGTYKNNINKGNASVTIRGLGDYCGTKVVKYTIYKYKILWWIW